MKQDLVVIYPADLDSVRIQKFAVAFKKFGVKLSFIGWNRNKHVKNNDVKFENVKYILSGGGGGTPILPFMYIWFIIKLFFTLLFSRQTNKSLFFAINLESALVLAVLSIFKDITFIYDIWDEFAISHNFPKPLLLILKKIDKFVRKRSYFYIHVDENRLSKIDNKNHIIIYNTPYDYCNSNNYSANYENSFAITGWLNNTRGLSSIYYFIKTSPEIKFIVIGEFIDKVMQSRYLEMDNVEYHHFMDQNKLFEIIKNTRGIFSLYDPSLEINRLAASNKLYDAMMLSIPVIVNTGILAESFVANNNIGYVINYNFDKSWDKLKLFNKIEVKEKGNNGRRKYLESYEFEKLLLSNFFPRIAEIINLTPPLNKK